MLILLSLSSNERRKLSRTFSLAVASRASTACLTDTKRMSPTTDDLFSFYCYFLSFGMFVLFRVLSTSHSAPTQSLVPHTAAGIFSGRLDHEGHLRVRSLGGHGLDDLVTCFIAKIVAAGGITEEFFGHAAVDIDQWQRTFAASGTLPCSKQGPDVQVYNVIYCTASAQAPFSTLRWPCGPLQKITLWSSIDRLRRRTLPLRHRNGRGERPVGGDPRGPDGSPCQTWSARILRFR